jgi:hypothetical protein
MKSLAMNDGPEGEEILEEILVGKWDCDTCEHLGNDGDAYDCSGCGSPRGEDVSFYLGDSPRLVKDKEGLESARAGLDWYCTYCDSGNSNAGELCDNCGATKGSARQHKIKAKQAKTGRFIPRPSPMKRRPLVNRKLGLAPWYEKLNWKIIGPGAAMLMLILLVWFMPRDITAELTESGWEHTAHIEQWQWQNEASWTAPKNKNVQEISSKKELHHNDQVIDHYRTQHYKEPYQIKTGQKRVQTGSRKVQDGTKAAQIGTKRVLALLPDQAMAQGTDQHIVREKSSCQLRSDWS